MPSANEMFNAYFAPAAADWQKESHLRTNAMKRAEMQRMEDLHMADWERNRAAPVAQEKPKEILISSKPDPVQAGIEKIVPTAVDDYVERVKHAEAIRSKMIADKKKEVFAARLRKGKIGSQKEVDMIDRAVESGVDEYIASQYPQLKSTFDERKVRMAEEERNREIEAASAGLGDSAKGLLLTGNRTSNYSSSGGGSTEVDTSRTGNGPARSLQDPVTQMLTGAFNRKAPDTSSDMERANFIRSQLPSLEEELMLTGGAEEYRKRLADIESGAYKKEKDFQDQQTDLSKNAATVLGQMETTERQKFKLQSDTLKSAAMNDTRIKAAKIVRDWQNARTGAMSATAQLGVLRELIKAEASLLNTNLRVIGGIAQAKIYNKSEMDQAKLDHAQGIVQAALEAIPASKLGAAKDGGAAIYAQFTRDALEAMTSPEEEGGEPRPFGGSYTYETKPGVEAPYYAPWRADIPAETKTLKGLQIPLPVLISGGGKKTEKPSGAPKFANRAAMLEYAKTLSPNKRLAFIQANKDLQ